MVLLFVIFCQSSFAQSSQINPKQAIQQSSISKQDKAVQNSNIDGQNENNEWSLSNKIATVAIILVFCQFVALCITIGIMKGTAVRQLRAYVLPDTGGLIDGTMLNPPDSSLANIPGAYLIIRNTGQTPAYNLISLAKIDIASINKPSLDVPLLHEVFSATLGVGSTMSKAIWFNRQLTQEELKNISKKTYAIYLHGRIEYRDVFKKRRITNFRFHYSGKFPPLKGMLFNFSEQGNDAK